MRTKGIFSINKLSSLYLRLMFFYLLVFIIPFSMAIVLVFTSSTALMYKEREKAVSSRLTDLSASFEKALDEAGRVSYSIIFNEAIIPNMMNINGNGSKECINALREYTSKNSMFNDIVVYFPKVIGNIVFSSRGTQSTDALNSYMPLNTNEGIKNFHEYIEKITQPIIIPAVNTYDYKDYNDLLYISPTYYPSTNWYMTAFYRIDNNSLKTLSSKVLADFEGKLYVYNNGGRDIYTYSGKKFKLTNDPVEFFKYGSSGISEIVLDNVKYNVFGSSAKNGLFNCVAIIPKEQFYIQIRQSQAFMWGITCIIGLAGIIIAVLFSLKTYMPIFKLQKIIQEEKSVQYLSSRDELVNITDEILATINENRRIGYVVQDITKLVREQMLYRLLNGEVSGSNLRHDLLTAAQINIPGPLYTTLCISLPKGLDVQTRSDITTAIQFGIIWHPGAIYPLYIEQENSIAVIASLNPGPDVRLQQERLASSIQNIVFSKFHLDILICSGKAYNDITSISKSYIEASAAMEHSDGMMENIIYFNNLEDDKSNGQSLLRQNTIRMLQSIKKGNEETALESLDAIFKEITCAGSSAGIARFKCSRLIDEIAETFISIGFWNAESLDENLEPLVSTSLLSRIKTQLSDIIRQACLHNRRCNSQHIIETMVEIKNHIDSNFHDPVINLEGIADAFSLSPYYLSREFKKHFGMNFIDYISYLRMNEAKQLLAGTDLKVKEIVDKIGYSDVPNFIRKFRIGEGMTPGHYRELYNKSTPSA